MTQWLVGWCWLVYCDFLILVNSVGHPYGKNISTVSLNRASDTCIAILSFNSITIVTRGSLARFSQLNFTGTRCWCPVRKYGKHMGKYGKIWEHDDEHLDQYLLIPFLGGWTSIYQLFWCSPGVQGFDTLRYGKIWENDDESNSFKSTEDSGLLCKRFNQHEAHAMVVHWLQAAADQIFMQWWGKGTYPSIKGDYKRSVLIDHMFLIFFNVVHTFLSFRGSV